MFLVLAPVAMLSMVKLKWPAYVVVNEHLLDWVVNGTEGMT